MPPSTHSSTVLAPFQSLFSAPTWRKVQRLIIGTLLARGRRTVTAALRHTGQGDTPSFSLYHQVLNRARWSALKGSRRLLSLLVQTFDTLGGTLTFVIDETLERRWGPRLKKRGHYRDALASRRKHAVTTSGLRWIVLALVITPPWSCRCWALPVLSLPAPTPGVSERLGLRHKTIAQWARQMIRVIRRWLPHAAITMLGDQAYSVVELAHACRQCAVRLIAPLRLDAVLHDAPPQRQPGTLGRPRLKGKRLPSLADRLKDAATLWEPLSVLWHEGRVQEIQMCSGTALWYRSGQPLLSVVEGCRSAGSWYADTNSRRGPSSRHARTTGPQTSCRRTFSAGALRRPSRKAVPIWASRRSVLRLRSGVVGPGDRADHAVSAGPVFHRGAVGVPPVPVG